LRALAVAARRTHYATTVAITCAFGMTLELSALISVHFNAARATGALLQLR
jgi:hypothetical protein